MQTCMLYYIIRIEVLEMAINRYWCTSCGAIIEADETLKAAYCNTCGDRIEFSNDKYSDELLNAGVETIIRAATRTSYYNKGLINYLSQKGVISAVLQEAAKHIRHNDYRSAEVILEGVYLNAKQERGNYKNETIRCIALLACVKYKLYTSEDKRLEVIDILDDLDKMSSDYLSTSSGEEVSSFVNLCCLVKSKLYNIYREAIVRRMQIEQQKEDDSWSNVDTSWPTVPTTLTTEDHNALDDASILFGLLPDVSDLM